MSVARFTVDDMVSVADTLEKARGEYISGLPHQDSLRSGTAEDSRSSQRQLFDTAVVLRRSSNTAASTTIVTSQPLNVVLHKEVCTSASTRYPFLTQVAVQHTPAHQAFQWQPYHLSGMVELLHVHGAS